MEQRNTLGICTATLIGALTEQPEVIGEDRNGRPIIVTGMVVTRPAKGKAMQGGRRQRQDHWFEITASGTAAENILRNWRAGRHVYILGEIAVTDTGISVHAAQLHWLDGQGSL